METEKQEDGTHEEMESHISNAVSALVSHKGLDDKAKVAKFKAALKMLSPAEVEEEEEPEGAADGGEEEPDGPEEEGEVAVDKKDEKERKEVGAEESIKELASAYPGVKRLIEELDAIKTKLALKEREELAHRLCEDAKLPSIAISETFLAQLIEAKDDKAMKRLVEDRKQVSRVQKPRSSGPIVGLKEGRQITTKDFAKQLKG